MVIRRTYEKIIRFFSKRSFLMLYPVVDIWLYLVKEELVKELRELEKPYKFEPCDFDFELTRPNKLEMLSL
jgi:hypothetical protein